MFKQFIKDYFTFSNSERRGIILMMAVIVVILIFRISYPHFIQSTDKEIKDFSHEVEQWLNSGSDNNSDIVNFNGNNRNNIVEFSLFRFNPNNISANEIKKLDINETAKSAWIKYLQKGGKFYRKEDLKKIYGIDSATFLRLEPYLDFDAIISNYHTNINNFKERKINLIEINTASQPDFEKLTGIGPVLALRIIKYRNLLGGFVAIDQLQEVYGVTDSIFNLNKDRLILDSTLVKKIDVNIADFKELSRHPYISNYNAKTIITYRNLQGDITSVKDLKINYIFNDSVLRKVLVYLSF